MIPTPYLTVPQLAERFGVKADKIIAWIKSGELRAMNVATAGGGRPRYRIAPDDLADFELRRSIATPTPRQRRRKTEGRVIAFF